MLCKVNGERITLLLVVSPLSFLTGVVHSEQTEEVRDESEALSQRNRTD
jgi:hypothetical protein